MTSLLMHTDLDTRCAEIVGDLTRRGFLTGTLGAATFAGLAACGSDDSSNAAATGWSFTDSLGTTVKLAKAPTRIVSTDDLVSVALIKAGLQVAASPLLPQGLFTALNIDHSDVTAIANAANEFNIEKAASAEPDLIVDFVQDGAAAVTTTTPILGKLAPVVALQVNNQSVEEVIETARTFVAAVRGEESAPDREAKERFAAAMAGLRTTVAAAPGLRAAIVLPVKDQLFVARPTNTPYQQTLAAAGLTFVADQGAETDYFQKVSWEQVADLPADVLIPISTLQSPPAAWSTMPAVTAGQVFEKNPTRWSGYFYDNYATLLEDFADFLATVRVVAPTA